MLLLSPQTTGPTACKYVYVCICMFILYVYVYDVYASIVFIYARISWNETLRHGNQRHVPDTQSLGAAGGGQHSGHSRTSGHPLLSAISNRCAHPFAHPPSHDTRQGPLKRPNQHRGLQCTIHTHNNSSTAHHSRSGRWESTQWPGVIGKLPWKSVENTSRQRFADVSYSQYMYVYVCIYSICMYMNVYAGT